MTAVFFKHVRTLAAVGTDTAVVTERYTCGAICTAVIAECFAAVGAVMAVRAHTIGAVDADAAVGTEFIQTIRAFAAFFTYTFRTVKADFAAFGAKLRAFAAQMAILTHSVIDTCKAEIAGGTEFVTADRANLQALGTQICAVFTAFSAGADRSAVRAKSADHAEVLRTAAVNTHAAFHTQLIICTFGAFFVALRADSIHAFRASATANANEIRAHLAGLAVVAEVTVTAGAVLADIASAADLFFGTVCTLFVTVRTDRSTA